MAKLYLAEGKEMEISPNDGKKFTIKELQHLVGGTVDIQMKPRSGGKRGARQCMIVNDNGKLTGLPINAMASKIWQEWYPIDKYPLNNDQTIVGDVLVCGYNQVR